MNLQIWRRNEKTGDWGLAWGLKPRSFPKATTEKTAVDAFLESTKRCTVHLALFRYPDWGNRPIILAQVNVSDEFYDLLKHVSLTENVASLDKRFDYHTEVSLLHLAEQPISNRNSTELI